jgi:Ca2+/Na+ antiporter
MASTPECTCTSPPEFTRRRVLQAGALGTLAGVATGPLLGSAMAASADTAALVPAIPPPTTTRSLSIRSVLSDRLSAAGAMCMIVFFSNAWVFVTRD